MALKAARSVAVARDEYTMSFNDIINYVPGKGRGDATPAKFIHRNGKILVNLTKNPGLVDIPQRANGKPTNKTGKTRIGMFLVQTDGTARIVTCGDGADGVKNWKPYNGTVTL